MTIDQIRQAADAIAGHVINTPCLHSRTLSQVTGAQIFLKFENLQFTASFKERGALNKLRSLDEWQQRGGVIAASAGNHAQGVAYHAQRLEIPAVIVMPRYSPGIKIEHTRDYGAEVVLHGELFDDAKRHALVLAEQRGLTWVDAYDDEQIIAGQGTIALEMLKAQPALDVLIAPIGGGGLIAGIAVAAAALKPGIEVIGVQTSRFPSMYAAVKGQPVTFGVSTIADGIAVKSPGKLTLPIIAKEVREISHQRAFTSLPVQTVHVEFVVQTRSQNHVREVIEALAKKGFQATLHLD